MLISGIEKLHLLTSLQLEIYTSISAIVFDTLIMVLEKLSDKNLHKSLNIILVNFVISSFNSFILSDISSILVVVILYSDFVLFITSLQFDLSESFFNSSERFLLVIKYNDSLVVPIFKSATFILVPLSKLDIVCLILSNSFCKVKSSFWSISKFGYTPTLKNIVSLLSFESSVNIIFSSSILFNIILSLIYFNNLIILFNIVEDTLLLLFSFITSNDINKELYKSINSSGFILYIDNLRWSLSISLIFFILLINEGEEVLVKFLVSSYCFNNIFSDVVGFNILFLIILLPIAVHE